jgi:arylsulfatase
MHFRTHVKKELRGISGQDEYSDGMVEHDMHIGKFLDKLDELGIADNTIVLYSTDNGPREEIFYFSDDGELTALRYKDWKAIFLEQRAEATFQAWREPFVPLCVPLLENLRRDLYERGMVTSNTYDDWFLDRVYQLMPAQSYVAEFLKTFQQFPPRQKAASFSLDQVMEKLAPPGG